jgi:hypothetical protein
VGCLEMTVTTKRVHGNRNVCLTIFLKSIRILSPGMSSSQLNTGHHILLLLTLNPLTANIFMSKWCTFCGPRPSPKVARRAFVKHNINTLNISISCFKNPFVVLGPITPVWGAHGYKSFGTTDQSQPCDTYACFSLSQCRTIFFFL